MHDKNLSEELVEKHYIYFFYLRKKIRLSIPIVLFNQILQGPAGALRVVIKSCVKIGMHKLPDFTDDVTT